MIYIIILMCRVLVFTDTHNNKEGYNRIISREDYDFVLFLGDYILYQDNPKPLYFIRGNHDYTDNDKEKIFSLPKFDNLNHIKTGKIYKHKI
ncbi:MAG: metallophosphoesterase, partial [archaeon]